MIQRPNCISLRFEAHKNDDIIENPCINELNAYANCIGPKVGVCLTDNRGLHLEDLSCANLNSPEFNRDFGTCRSDFRENDNSLAACSEVEEFDFLRCIAICSRTEQDLPTYSPSMARNEQSTLAALSNHDDIIDLISGE